jgi:Domain of unknown function (DUF4375)
MEGSRNISLIAVLNLQFLVEALETVGAPKTAAICKRAIETAFPTGLPQSVEAIRSAAASFPDEVLAALEPIDNDFFSYPHNLTNLLFSYVSQHPEEFGPLPKADDRVIRCVPRPCDTWISESFHCGHYLI